MSQKDTILDYYSHELEFYCNALDTSPMEGVVFCAKEYEGEKD